MGCRPSQFQTQDQLHAHSAKGFIVSCMDFRLIDDIVKFMDGKGYNNNYDQFILAGGSLGFIQEKFPHWGQSLLDHMNIGQSLHGFRQIIFIDHMDCGAYKKFYPQISCSSDEITHHKKNMQLARNSISKIYKNYKFSGYLMNLDGSVQSIDTVEAVKYDERLQETEQNKFLGDIQKSHGLQK